MWFTNEGKLTRFQPATHSIGRITTAGVVTTLGPPTRNTAVATFTVTIS